MVLACMTVQGSIGGGVFLGHLTIGISFRVICSYTVTTYISRKIKSAQTTYVTGFAKTVPKGTRIEIPFIAWHES